MTKGTVLSRRAGKLSCMGVPTRSRLRWGSYLVAISYAIATLASYAILSTHPDTNTRAGRHLLAGALAIASLSVVEVLIAVFPLRRGEAWAFCAAPLPLISLVLPMLILDAGHIAPEHRLSTLTPFVIGLVLAICGLILTRSAGT